MRMKRIVVLAGTLVSMGASWNWADDEAVTPLKQRRLRALALEWLQGSTLHPRELRFDVVSIVGDAIEVLEAAF